MHTDVHTYALTCPYKEFRVCDATSGDTDSKKYRSIDEPSEGILLGPGLAYKLILDSIRTPASPTAAYWRRKVPLQHSRPALAEHRRVLRPGRPGLVVVATATSESALLGASASLGAYGGWRHKVGPHQGPHR